MSLPNVTLLVSLDPLLRERAVASARGHHRDLVVVRHELASAELAEGADGWRGWPDPMSPGLGDGADLLTTQTEDPA